MPLRELIATLQAEGFVVSRGRVRAAVRGGHLRPKPRKGFRDAYQFSPRHVGQLKWYFANIRPGPRPANPTEFAAVASNDRIHRFREKLARIASRRASQKARKESLTRMWDEIEELEAKLGITPQKRAETRAG